MSTSIEILPNDSQTPGMNSNTSTNTGSTPINFNDTIESDYIQTDGSDYDSDTSSINRNSVSGINQAYNTRQNQNGIKPRESSIYINSKNNIKKTVKINHEPEFLNESDIETIQPLPSRDIPINPLLLSSDQEINPSFMKQESQKDYIRDFESIQELKENAKREEEERNSYEKYLTYFLVSLLYVFLQLPLIKIMFKYNLPKLFTEEGIPKFSYHILLGLILGIMFFGIDTYVLKELKLKEIVNFNL